jgi:hypothetical protein
MKDARRMRRVGAKRNHGHDKLVDSIAAEDSGTVMVVWIDHQIHREIM